MTTLAHANDWAARYFDAWKSNDRAMVESLFTEDAVYYYGPFREPARGRDEIVRRWIENGAQRNVSTAYEVIAASGDTAVIHWTVSFDTDQGMTSMDGVIIGKFDDRGACREHREWYTSQTVPSRRA
jgi:ketosteroid isomerase-like protein